MWRSRGSGLQSVTGNDRSGVDRALLRLHAERGRRHQRAEITIAPESCGGRGAEFAASTMAQPVGIRLEGDPMLHLAPRQDVVIWPLELAANLMQAPVHRDQTGAWRRPGAAAGSGRPETTTSGGGTTCAVSVQTDEAGSSRRILLLPRARLPSAPRLRRGRCAAMRRRRERAGPDAGDGAQASPTPP